MIEEGYSYTVRAGIGQVPDLILHEYQVTVIVAGNDTDPPPETAFLHEWLLHNWAGRDLAQVLPFPPTDRALAGYLWKQVIQPRLPTAIGVRVSSSAQQWSECREPLRIYTEVTIAQPNIERLAQQVWRVLSDRVWHETGR